LKKNGDIIDVYFGCCVVYITVEVQPKVFLSNISALVSSVSENMFLVFVLCKNNTCDPKDRAYFEPRAII
jgi:hypothetical protein